MKKLLLLPLLLLLCAFLTVAVSAVTAEGVYGENITWKYDTETGHLEVDGSGPMDDWGEALWCDYYETLQSITVGDGITHIGAYTFRYLEKLTEVSLPDSVTSIGELAFTGCSELRHFSFPPNLTEIGASAFRDCSLYEIELPETVTGIGEFAFWYCGGVQEIRIPASVTELSGSAFNKCVSLRTLTVDPANPVYHSAGSCIIETASGTLVAGCRGSVIPDDGSVARIGEYAFACCDYLTGITIPEGVTSIGANAFEDCIRLRSVSLPESVDFIGGSAFLGCTALSELTLPSGLTTLDERALFDCGSLQTIDLPDSLLVIGDQAFYGCSSLTELVFPENTVLFVGMFAFGGCEGLTELALPQSVSAIDWCAFGGCTNLRTLTFHSGVEEIASGAFEGCSALETINYFGSMAQWDAIDIGGDNDILERVTIHFFIPPETIREASCTELGQDGFVCEDCGIYSVTHPPLGHDFAEVYVPASGDTPGYDALVCSRCGETIVLGYRTEGARAENDTLGSAVVCLQDPEDEVSILRITPKAERTGDTILVTRRMANGRMREMQTLTFTGEPLELELVRQYDEIRIFSVSGWNPTAEMLTLSAPW